MTLRKIAGVILMIYGSFHIAWTISRKVFDFEYGSNGMEFLFLMVEYIYPIGDFGFILLGLSYLLDKSHPSGIQDSLKSTDITVTSDVIDGSSLGLNILSFLVPIVGLVVYFSFKDTNPIRAKSAGIASLVGFGLSMSAMILIGFISIVT